MPHHTTVRNNATAHYSYSTATARYSYSTATARYSYSTATASEHSVCLYFYNNQPEGGLCIHNSPVGFQMTTFN